MGPEPGPDRYAQLPPFLCTSAVFLVWYAVIQALSLPSIVLPARILSYAAPIAGLLFDVGLDALVSLCGLRYLRPCNAHSCVHSPCDWRASNMC
jgi:hypothetical protein